MLMMSERGCDGHQLHGGGADRFSKGGFLEAYQYMDGKLFAGMVVCEFMLADEGPGDGEHASGPQVGWTEIEMIVRLCVVLFCSRLQVAVLSSKGVTKRICPHLARYVR